MDVVEIQVCALCHEPIRDGEPVVTTTGNQIAHQRCHLKETDPKEISLIHNLELATSPTLTGKLLTIPATSRVPMSLSSEHGFFRVTIAAETPLPADGSAD